MAVDDWFYEFYDAHTARHPRVGNPKGDWPDLDSEDGKAFFSGLRSLFVLRGVHELAVATLASESLMGVKLWEVADHPKALVDAAAEIYKARAADGGARAATSDRDSAALASKGCVYCDGQGLAVVWAAEPDPEEKVAETSSAYCICALGRWFESAHREKAPDIHRRIPLLANVLNGRSSWRLNPAWMTPADTSSGVRMAPVPAAPDPRAAEASRDCPECRGTGWARRRAKWETMDRPFVVVMFCRCPLGSWRHAHDPDVARNHDSLQAHPEIWDGALSHRSWGDRPIPADVATADDTDGRWRYLRPDEPSPAPMASVRDVAGQAARDLAPSERRRWPDGLGRVEPAVPIPPKQAAPAPPPAPTIEPVTEESLEWL